MSVRLLLADENESAFRHVFQEEGEVFLRENDAAIGAAELAMLLQEGRLGIIGGVDDDGPVAGVRIGLVEPIEAERAAVLADILLGDEIGASYNFV